MSVLDGPQRSPRSGRPPVSLVVLLHGRGSNGEDLIGLADLIAPEFPDTAFHSPDAPIPLGPFGYMWFNIDSEDREGEIQTAEGLINEFIDELADRYSLPPAKIALVGFSQGSIMSIHTAPRREGQLAGVVAFSGAMFTGDSLDAAVRSRPPFVLVHGADDLVLDAQESVKTAARFNELNIPVEVHILPGLPHSVDKRGLDIAAGFLKGVLA